MSPKFSFAGQLSGPQPCFHRERAVTGVTPLTLADVRGPAHREAIPKLTFERWYNLYVPQIRNPNEPYVVCARKMRTVLSCFFPLLSSMAWNNLKRQSTRLLMKGGRGERNDARLTRTRTARATACAWWLAGVARHQLDRSVAVCRLHWLTLGPGKAAELLHPVCQ